MISMLFNIILSIFVLLATIFLGYTFFRLQQIFRRVVGVRGWVARVLSVIIAGLVYGSIYWLGVFGLISDQNGPLGEGVTILRVIVYPFLVIALVGPVFFAFSSFMHDIDDDLDGQSGGNAEGGVASDFAESVGMSIGESATNDGSSEIDADIF